MSKLKFRNMDELKEYLEILETRVATLESQKGYSYKDAMKNEGKNTVARLIIRGIIGIISAIAILAVAVIGILYILHLAH